MKGILKKVLVRGKVTVLAVVVALMVGTASAALAANGDNFILGVLSNSATAITKLTANIAGPALQLVNTSTSAGATALNLQTASNKPPMTVNSKTKVANLNADSVDGKSAEQLSRVAMKESSATTELDFLAPVTYGNSQLSITAPAAGFVRVNGNVTVINETCTNQCAFSGAVRHIQTGSQSLPAQDDVDSRNGNVGLDKVFPVKAGVNTFDIQLTQLSGEGELHGFFSSLTAEYTPYGSTGTGTLGTASDASASFQEDVDKKEP